MKVIRPTLIILLLSSGNLWAGRHQRTWEKEDRWALSITNRDAVTIDALVKKIKSFRTDDWGHFRIAFRWVAENVAYDVPASKLEKTPYQSVEQTLRNRKAVCAGYANLLQVIAVRLGIRTEIVSGFAKQHGVCYEKLDKSTHAWNAANLNGDWYLFDATWAAGSVNKEGRYKKAFEDFYFAPEPEELLFNHLPEDPRWQLVTDSVTREAFESRCSIDVSLFRMGLTAATVKQMCPDVECQFVDVSHISSTMSISRTEMPFGKILSAGKAYTFTIWANESARFSIENMPTIEKGKPVMLYQNWMTDLPCKSGVSRIMFTPQPGDLSISISEGGESERIFKWRVVE